MVIILFNLSFMATGNIDYFHYKVSKLSWQAIVETLSHYVGIWKPTCQNFQFITIFVQLGLYKVEFLPILALADFRRLKHSQQEHSG